MATGAQCARCLFLALVLLFVAGAAAAVDARTARQCFDFPAGGPKMPSSAMILEPLFMPIYEFDCASCGHDFQRLQKLSDADPDQCPVCASQGTVRRLISAPSFRLAGSGWYETDFKSDRDRKRNLAGDQPPPAAADSSGSSADSAGKTPTPAPAATAAAVTP